MEKKSKIWSCFDTVIFDLTDTMIFEPPHLKQKIILTFYYKPLTVQSEDFQRFHSYSVLYAAMTPTDPDQHHHPKLL